MPHIKKDPEAGKKTKTATDYLSQSLHKSTYLENKEVAEAFAEAAKAENEDPETLLRWQTQINEFCGMMQNPKFREMAMPQLNAIIARCERPNRLKDEIALLKRENRNYSAKEIYDALQASGVIEELGHRYGWTNYDGKTKQQKDSAFAALVSEVEKAYF